MSEVLSVRGMPTCNGKGHLDLLVPRDPGWAGPASHRLFCAHLSPVITSWEGCQGGIPPPHSYCIPRNHLFSIIIPRHLGTDCFQYPLLLAVKVVFDQA